MGSSKSRPLHGANPEDTIVMTAEHTIQSATRAISARCDGAATDDGQGFNGQDTVFGKAIAMVPDSQWSAAHLATAHAMLRKYRGQLAGAGIDYDAITTPAAAETSRVVRLVDTDGTRIIIAFTYDPALIAAVKWAVPQARFDGSIKAWVAPAAARDHALTFAAAHGFAVTEHAKTLAAPAATERHVGTVDVTSALDGLRFALRFDYDARLVAAIRDLPGRAWDGDRKMWTMPLDRVRAVRAFAAEHGFTFTDAAAACPDVESDTRPCISVERGEFVLRFDYDRDLKALVKSLPGAHWAAVSNAWQAPLSAAVELHQFVNRIPCRYGQDVTDALAAVQAELAAVADSIATDADLTVPTLARDLYPFQRAGVAYALAHPRTFIGDDMGLGKTLQAIATLEVLGAFPAVVVCPALVKINWEREFAAALPHRTVHIINGRTPRVLPQADVYVINYDVLPHHVAHLQTRKAVVFDESHYMSNATAARSVACLALVKGLADTDPVLLLSGTPTSGKAKEMVHQLRVMGTLPIFGGARGFMAQARDRRDMPALNRRMRATCLLRRLKGDVLADLPPRRWAPVYVEGDTAVMADYRRAEKDLLTFLRAAALQAALDAGASTPEAEEEAWRAAARASAAEHLVAVNVLRQLAARAKMPAVREWLTSTDSKVIAFGWHTEIVEAIATEFAAGCRIQGGMTTAARQGAVDRFQAEDSQRVIACQIKAAGVGITLTASSDVVFIEQGWTPTDMDQAVDRAHRIGQTDSVTGWIFMVADTVDEMMAALIADKRKTTQALLDGKVGAEEGVGRSILSDLVERLTEQALAHA